jgi:hypothetical protein
MGLSEEYLSWICESFRDKVWVIVITSADEVFARNWIVAAMPVSFYFSVIEWDRIWGHDKCLRSDCLWIRGQATTHLN